MLQEECIQSFNQYSNELEHKIETIITLRGIFASIESYDALNKEKGRIIQLMFEIEDILRNSCQFLRTNYFQLKQSYILEKNKTGNFTSSFDNPCVMTFPQLSLNYLSKGSPSIIPDFSKEKPNGNQSSLVTDNQLIMNQNQIDDIIQQYDTFPYNTLENEIINKSSIFRDDRKDNEMISRGNMGMSSSYPNCVDINSKENSKVNSIHLMLNTNDIIGNKENIIIPNDKEFNTIVEIGQMNRNLIDSIKQIEYTDHLNNNIEDTITSDGRNYQSKREAILDDDSQDPQNSSKTKRARTQESVVKQCKRTLSIGELNIEPNCKTIKHYQSKSNYNPSKQGKLNNHPTELYNIDYDAIIRNPDSVIRPQCKAKTSKITNLIFKIKTNEELNLMMKQLFGNELLDHLMEGIPSEEFISDVEKAINTIENLQQRDKERKLESIDNHKGINYPINLDYNSCNSKHCLRSREKRNNLNATTYSSFFPTFSHSIKKQPDLHSHYTKKSYADKLLEKNGFNSSLKHQKILSQTHKNNELLSQNCNDYQISDKQSYKSFVNDTIVNIKGILSTHKSFNINKNSNDKKVKTSKKIHVLTSKKKSTPSHKVLKVR